MELAEIPQPINITRQEVINPAPVQRIPQSRTIFPTKTLNRNLLFDSKMRLIITHLAVRRQCETISYGPASDAHAEEKQWATSIFGRTGL